MRNVPPISRELQDCIDDLQKKYLSIEEKFTRLTGKELLITCTYRSPSIQYDLFKSGREEKNGIWLITDPKKVLTYVDGINKKGNHNVYPSAAIDVAVYLRGKVFWDEIHYYPLLPICREFGLRSGGEFQGWQDWQHIELP